jgi:hypothetical protein
MYENLCGNCVGRIELTFDNGIKKIKCTLMNIALHIDLTIFKIARL